MEESENPRVPFQREQELNLSTCHMHCPSHHVPSHNQSRQQVSYYSDVSCLGHWDWLGLFCWNSSLHHVALQQKIVCLVDQFVPHTIYFLSIGCRGLVISDIHEYVATCLTCDTFYDVLSIYYHDTTYVS